MNAQMEITVRRSERLTHRIARPMIMEPTPVTHALFDMGKALNALKDRNVILERELAALREKHRCKSAADEQFAMALTKAQTRIETLDHELTEASKDIAKLTKENMALKDNLKNTNVSAILNSIGHLENEILSLKEQLDRLRSELDGQKEMTEAQFNTAEKLRAELAIVTRDRDSWMQNSKVLGEDYNKLEQSLAFAREVLEEARPLVKGRLLSLDGRDLSVLTRIESAIASV